MIQIGLIQDFFRFLTIPFTNLNFIDIAIIVVIIVYAIEGYALGFIRGLADFITFLLSFFFGLTFYNVFSSILVNNIKIPKGFGNAMGFFLGAFIAEIALSILFRTIILPFILERVENLNYSIRAEKLTGIIPGIFSAVVLLTFILTMIVALPLSPFLKNSVSASKLGEPLVTSITGLDKNINNVFGGAVNDALTFLTVEPKSQELLKLNFSTDNIHPDEVAESQMLASVNKERKIRDISPLIGDITLRETARKHCSDMFERGYFSHYTPEGKSPFDRMAEDNISFNFAGENLALAPNIDLAMQGLMNSSGHREDILSKNFKKVGIGVIDSGVYGEMFCQEFTD